MGVIDDSKSTKPEKPSSPAPTDQANVQAYPPDWAAMQAYYGHQVPLPPYYNPAMAAGHPPHPYVWAPPQHMMTPYGAHPYAAMYQHGGVFAHPGVPLAPHGHGVPVSPAAGETMAATQLSIETPAKSSGNYDKGFMKKLKRFDGLAMSIGNGTSDSAEGASDNDVSQSAGTEGSSDGSDGNTVGDQHKRSRSPDGTTTNGNGRKTETQPKATHPIGIVSGIATPPCVTGKMAGNVLSPTMPMALDLMNHSSAGVPKTGAMMPSESRSERDMKRERRKQSNRESARRSRLRKQAESEELAVKVEALNAENLALRSEMNCLTENSEKLRLENVKLMEELKLSRQGQTENLISRVNNNSSPANRSSEEDGERHGNNNNSNSKLRRLMDEKSQSDAVSAR